MTQQWGRAIDSVGKETEADRRQQGRGRQGERHKDRAERETAIGNRKRERKETQSKETDRTRILPIIGQDRTSCLEINRMCFKGRKPPTNGMSIRLQ